MPLGTRVRRPTFGSPYQTRRRYLESKNPDDPRFCHIVNDVSDTGREPWFTLVVGSGCATSRNQVNALLQTVARLRNLVGNRYAHQNVEGAPLDEIVELYANDLIRDRLQLDSIPPPGVAATRGEMDIEEWTADVLVLGALTGKLYFQIKGASFEAPRRRLHEDDAVLSPESRHWGRLVDEYLNPCQRLLDRLQGQVEVIARALARFEGEKMRGTVDALLARLSHSLNPGADREIRLRAAELQSLTEFNWFCLASITEPKVYPGWSDLLLDLSIYESRDASRLGTPLFRTMTQAQSLIRTRFEEFTRLRYRQMTGPSERRSEGDTQIYSAVAELLCAEHSRRAHSTGSTAPPPASVFVTSFDVEIELSLLKRGTPFIVAIPVHVVNTMDDVAHTCWIALRVPASKAGGFTPLHELLEPREENWRLLDDKVKLDMPIVVRLAGCPLITLPDLQNATGIRSDIITLFEEALRIDAADDDEKLRGIKETLMLQPAVVLSEHDAELQNAIDLITIPSGLPSGLPQSGAQRRYGLPMGLVTDSWKWSRFWVMLGVQVHDSAFRHRIASLVSSVPRTTPSGRTKDAPRGKAPEQSSEPARTQMPKTEAGRLTGLAVNMRTTERQRDFLFWNGFDVVNAEAEVFAEDLLHCAGHHQRGIRFTRGGLCNA